MKATLAHLLRRLNKMRKTTYWIKFKIQIGDVFGTADNHNFFSKSDTKN